MENQIKKLPQKIGVYIFKDNLENILYIGKAKNIKKRVKSHFQGKGGVFGGAMAEKAAEIDFIKTGSEKNARILEQQLIKKYKPRFNIEWQDDKNFFWAGIGREDFPRVFLTHQPGKEKEKSVYLGPFVSGREAKDLLEKLRVIFPFRTCRRLAKNKCLYYDLGLCPAPCLNKRQKKKYQKIILALAAVLEIYLGKAKRIEGYDVSNIGGSQTVGSMVVFKSGKAKKPEYRKFKIKKVKGQNDIQCLREIILRRLRHAEWPRPDLILIDGGKGQLKAAKGIGFPVLALAKDKKNSGKLFSFYSKKSLLLDDLPKELKNLFLQVRDEAHRFAITYHKKKRDEYFRF